MTNEQIEPCPNCGGGCALVPNLYLPLRAYVCCTRKCGYCGPESELTQGAVRPHNRIARAVREGSELSHLAGHYLTRAEAAEAKLADAAAIIRKLAWLLGRSREDTDAPAHAKEWLRKNGLSGDVLRDLPAPEGEKE